MILSAARGVAQAAVLLDLYSFHGGTFVATRSRPFACSCCKDSSEQDALRQDQGHQCRNDWLWLKCQKGRCSLVPLKREAIVEFPEHSIISYINIAMQLCGFHPPPTQKKRFPWTGSYGSFCEAGGGLSSSVCLAGRRWWEIHHGSTWRRS